MDPRQRVYDPEETFRAAVESVVEGLWTALPAIVVSFDPAKMTISAQPTVPVRWRRPDATFVTITLPVLQDIPVVWLGGGGVTGVFPITPKDEALLIFSSLCIDGWWSLGTVAPAPEQRRYDLSDGFALVGLRSLPRVFPVPAGVAGLVTDDGQTYITLNPSSKAVAAKASGGINLNGVVIDASGNITGAQDITASGTVTGQTDVVAAGISGSKHTHTSAASGSPTSPPNPGT